MHPDISLWPNKYFYGGILKDGDTKSESKVVPFLVIDVEGDAVTEKGNCYNKMEEKVVIDLVKAIKEVHGKQPNNGSHHILLKTETEYQPGAAEPEAEHQQDCGQHSGRVSGE